ncbi:hypothetical protein U9M48_041730, partial [Paspalum notatum var. saurae]
TGTIALSSQATSQTTVQLGPLRSKAHLIRSLVANSPLQDTAGPGAVKRALPVPAAAPPSALRGSDGTARSPGPGRETAMYAANELRWRCRRGGAARSPPVARHSSRRPLSSVRTTARGPPMRCSAQCRQAHLTWPPRSLSRVSTEATVWVCVCGGDRAAGVWLVGFNRISDKHTRRQHAVLLVLMGRSFEDPLSSGPDEPLKLWARSNIEADLHDVTLNNKQVELWELIFVESKLVFVISLVQENQTTRGSGVGISSRVDSIVVVGGGGIGGGNSSTSVSGGIGRDAVDVIAVIFAAIAVVYLVIVAVQLKLLQSWKFLDSKKV